MIVARSDPAGLIDRKSVVKNDKESLKRRRRTTTTKRRKMKDRIGGWRR
jgi:hypothetical protein